MSIIKKIKESFGKGKLKKEQREELLRILQSAVFDGKITDEELNQINRFFYISALSKEEFDEAKDKIFLACIDALIDDRRINEDELNALEHIAYRLAISRQTYANAQKEFSYFNLLDSIDRGHFPSVNPRGVILKNGESAYFEAPGYLLEERVIKREIVGRSQGVSIRLMRGVSYRVGSSRGTIQSQTGLVNVSSGNFVITNSRLMFSGQNKSFAHDFSKLIDIQMYADAIQFSVTNRQKPIIVGMHSPRAVEVGGLLISKILNA